MELLIFFAIGLLIGIGLLFWLQQPKIQKLEQTEKQLKQARKELEAAEQSHESRMQETIKSLQTDYQNQSIQEIEKLKRKHENELTNKVEEVEKKKRDEIQELEGNLQSQLHKVEEFYQNRIQTLEKENQRDVQSSIPASQVEQPINGAEETQVTSPTISTISTDLPSVSEQQTQDKNKTSHSPEKNLTEIITVLGDSGQIANIPRLVTYLNHPDSQIRCLVASALGQLSVSQGIREEIQQAIPILGKLSRDSEISVRQAAVKALGKIKSEKVIPLLQIAAKDSNSEVVRLASAAFNQLKVYRVKSRGKPIELKVKPTSDRKI